MTNASGEGAVIVAYYYRVHWGRHDEFLSLFRRNHYPILAEQLREGRFLAVRCYRPRFHGDGKADWTFMVTITFRDWAAMEAHSDAEIAKRLFPDQDRYRSEERRRFELLDAHWDVPLEDVALEGDDGDKPKSGLGFAPPLSPGSPGR
jgi:quinol monooxygenase YgiN